MSENGNDVRQYTHIHNWLPAGIIPVTLPPTRHPLTGQLQDGEQFPFMLVFCGGQDSCAETHLLPINMQEAIDMINTFKQQAAQGGVAGGLVKP